MFFQGKHCRVSGKHVKCLQKKNKNLIGFLQKDMVMFLVFGENIMFLAAFVCHCIWSSVGTLSYYKVVYGMVGTLKGYCSSRPCTGTLVPWCAPQQWSRHKMRHMGTFSWRIVLRIGTMLWHKIVCRNICKVIRPYTGNIAMLSYAAGYMDC